MRAHTEHRWLTVCNMCTELDENELNKTIHANEQNKTNTERTK